MNGLKEITKMLGDSTSERGPKTAIPQQKLTDWLLENRVLSVSLEGRCCSCVLLSASLDIVNLASFKVVEFYYPPRSEGI